MKWRGRRVSTNVDDRRGQSPRRGPVGRRGAGVGCGGLLLVLVLSFLTGNDPLQLLEAIGGEQASTQGSGFPDVPSAPPQDALGEFAGVVLAETEDTWNTLFRQMGRNYREPTLVLFSGGVNSACGFNSSAVGPFYCPADSQVYLDLSFFDELSRRFGAAGDFAQAYVIAHEIGHHVQNQLGISSQVAQMRQRSSQTQSNQLSVRLELQADCFAGVWGRFAYERNLLEPGDLEEAMRAAAAIGDDNIQRRSSGRIRPESWTHGSSEQRQEWLRRGLQSGDPQACETFQ
ncbi:MAG: neutral zinc metallopeptidase [Acidobacteriota bacterium]